MNNTYKNLSIAAYIFSGITSLIFLVGFGIKFIDKVLAVIITIIFEPSKPVTFVQIFKKHDGVIKGCIIFLWIILEVASISASTSYMLNMTNKAYELSPAYQAMQEKKKNLNGLIAADKKALETANKNMEIALNNDNKTQGDNTKLINEYNGTIRDLTRQKKLLNNDLQSAINRNAKKPCQNTISRLKTEIKGIEGQINTTTKARDNVSAGGNVAAAQAGIDEINGRIKSNEALLNNLTPGKTEKQTEGYMSLFTPVGKIVGMDPEILAFVFFFLIFGVAPEIAGNLFFYLHKKENGLLDIEPDPEGNPQGRKGKRGLIDKITNKLGNKTPAPAPGPSMENDFEITAEDPQVIDLNSKRKNKNRVEGSGLDPLLVQEYLKTLYDIARQENSEFAAGYRRISKIINIDPETVGRKIMNYISISGITESVTVNGRKKTRIIKWEQGRGVI